MKVIETPLPGVVIVEPKNFGDQRGFFLETYSRQRYIDNGITSEFVQDNHSRSQNGVLRGLHYQLNNPQAKLVSVIRGTVIDVAVDIRVGSPTFGWWHRVLLSEENHRQLFIPEGYAHGFVVLSEVADFVYKCSEYYSPGDERGLLWSDPEIGIDWEIESPVLSDKDKNNRTLNELRANNELPVYERK